MESIGPPTIAAVVGVDAARKVNDLLRRLFGPAAEEAGEWLRDGLRSYRVVSVAKMALRVDERLRAVGAEAQPVARKLLFPILDGVSFEGDDPELVELWAGLLVAAARGRPILVSYARILSEITPAESRVLETMYQHYLSVGDAHKIEDLATPREKIAKAVELADRDLDLLFENLLRLRLIKPDTIYMGGGSGYGPISIDSMATIYLSVLGHGFMCACHGEGQES